MLKDEQYCLLKYPISFCLFIYIYCHSLTETVSGQECDWPLCHITLYADEYDQMGSGLPRWLFQNGAVRRAKPHWMALAANAPTGASDICIPRPWAAQTAESAE